jgi:hypothetical protein
MQLRVSSNNNPVISREPTAKELTGKGGGRGCTGVIMVISASVVEEGHPKNAGRDRASTAGTPPPPHPWCCCPDMSPTGGAVVGSGRHRGGWAGRRRFGFHSCSRHTAPTTRPQLLWALCSGSARHRNRPPRCCCKWPCLSRTGAIGGRTEVDMQEKAGDAVAAVAACLSCCWPCTADVSAAGPRSPTRCGCCCCLPGPPTTGSAETGRSGIEANKRGNTGKGVPAAPCDCLSHPSCCLSPHPTTSDCPSVGGWRASLRVSKRVIYPNRLPLFHP